ncbi:uncharacterized protein K460DRAFT_57425 [Cucurbitaria berberidis CBS 394.84]|uniref:Uncharacterized protein n=1 Tax=Cucurbitaria berberidis CBS 394.84 TaxID=1168544 RepID=A0A9P4GJG7_9PLEO|nr:uncharacterized protein K460DRAFT_57425 [Cucurbitaria berberidis CBS 394.84]KAF1847378.1 hypothetical protein K460DRAFT_57425 [Cucurbitaria berberidis CBS 394.84]
MMSPHTSCSKPTARPPACNCREHCDTLSLTGPTRSFIVSESIILQSPLARTLPPHTAAITIVVLPVVSSFVCVSRETRQNGRLKVAASFTHSPGPCYLCGSVSSCDFAPLFTALLFDRIWLNLD